MSIIDSSNQIDLFFLKDFLTNLCNEYELKQIDLDIICQKVDQGKFDNMTIENVNTLIINSCDDLSSMDTMYSVLGARVYFTSINNQIIALNLFTFADKIQYISDSLPNYINESFLNFIQSNSEFLNGLILNESSILPSFIDLFSYRTLEGSYLIQVNGQTIEQPLDMFLRVAIAIHYRQDISLEERLELIKETYYYLSNGYFIHATPTLFNAGTNFEQLSSCYLLGTEDSLDGIFKTVHDSANISKWSGGIGVHVSNIRCKGTRIKSTNGESSGIIPMLKVYNDVARYINQGGRGKKRPGAIAVYLEPWHGDIMEFLELKLNSGADEMRARDLFLALWIPDLFMKQVECNGDWYLMCPEQCSNLADVYGEEFETLYNQYVADGKYIKQVKANDIWLKIAISQAESGVPYILYKDNINKKSNQKNIGTIKSSNLCAEITEVSSNTEYAVCNLASIAINKYIKDDLTYDFDKLYKVARIITKNLNNIIDINYYPTPETLKSNISTRPIGIGIQGVANLFLEMRLPYDSQEALDLQSKIMETIYYGALEMSAELAEKFGPYSMFEGSPFSQGIFQFDMWNTTPKIWSFDSLREKIMKTGTRNSLLTALMPTASTSQILGNFECFEPITSNLYTRKTAAGVFKIVNKYLIKDLKKLNMWNEDIKNKIIINNGSVQHLDIPIDLKQLYKTVWEIKQKWIIDHALIRSPYVDQSQSMNLFFEAPDMNKIKSALFYGWKHGLKTGCYYLRTQPASKAANIIEKECMVCSA